MGIPEGTPQDVANRYLGVGERVFDYATGLSYGSAYFEREGKSHSK